MWMSCTHLFQQNTSFSVVCGESSLTSGFSDFHRATETDSDFMAVVHKNDEQLMALALWSDCTDFMAVLHEVINIWWLLYYDDGSIEVIELISSTALYLCEWLANYMTPHVATVEVSLCYVDCCGGRVASIIFGVLRCMTWFHLLDTPDNIQLGHVV